MTEFSISETRHKYTEFVENEIVMYEIRYKRIVDVRIRYNLVHYIRNSL